MIRLAALATAMGLAASSSFAADQGLRYYLPKDLIVVDVTITTETTTQVQKDLSIKKIVETTREGVLSLKTVPDHQATRVLDPSNGAFSDTSISATLSASGLLKSINAANVGRGGDFLSSLGKFVGGFIGLLPVLPAPAGTPPQGKAVCDVMTGPLSELPATLRLFLRSAAQNCDDWSHLNALQESIVSAESQAAQLTGGIAEAGGDQAVAEIRKKLAALDTAIRLNTRNLVAEQTAFSSRLDAFLKDKGVGSKSSVAHMTGTFAPGDLPAVFSGAQTVSTVDAAITNADVKAFFRSAGVVVGAKAQPSSSGAGSPGAQDSKDHLVLSYRPCEQFNLVLYAVKGDVAGTSAVEPAVQQLVELLLPGREATLSLKKSAFSDGKLALVFDDRSQPTTFDRSESSKAAGIVDALARGVQATRDELDATLAKAVSIQNNRKTLDLGDLNAQIDTLKKRKEALDAQLALKSSAATFDMSLQQNQLNADLGLLQAQLNLDVARATQDQKLDIEKMKVDLENLKTQVEVLKAIEDLKKAQSDEQP